MDKSKLTARIKELRAQAHAILTDETREFTPEDQKKFDAIMAKCALIEKRLDSLEALEAGGGDEPDGDEGRASDPDGDGPEEDDEDETEAPVRSARPDPAHAAPRGPAAVRSRGRRSAPAGINEHAARHGYSVVRAVNSFLKRGRLEGVEAETHQELTRGGYPCAGSFRMPLGNASKLSRRDLTLTTGAGAVPVITDGSEFIDYLYPKMVGPQLGFRYIEGLQGVTKFPRQSSVPTVEAVAESGAATGSAPGVDYVQFSPKTMTANVTISRKFAMQSVVSADRYVMEAGSRQIGVQLDQWAISGDGAANRPYGLVNNTAFTQFQAATSNTVAYGDTLAMRKQVAAANALFGNLGWLTSPAGYAKLSQTPKLGTTFPVFIIDDDGNILGEKCVQSSQVSANVTYCGTSGLTQLVYGNWEMLAVALFGNGLDIIVDPFTGSKQGDLIITFLLDADTNLLQPKAFSACPNVGE